MKAKAYCNLGIFFLADRAIMPTDARTPSRWHLSIEPVEVFDYRNRTEFIAACERAIARGMPEISMPSDDQMSWDEHGPTMKESVTLKYAKLATWDDLERSSIYVSVECYDRGFLIESWGRAKDGKWSDEESLELRLDPAVGVEGVVDTILEHLKSRKDLPGMTFDFRQPKTAKGA
ncbi:MAG: hypothetical protein IT342_04890 [Candidatus Melainabacteria bacterium]|nr:hypothetical protein [Candidatus Melainabacteria bacterium]